MTTRTQARWAIRIAPALALWLLWAAHGTALLLALPLLLIAALGALYELWLQDSPPLTAARPPRLRRRSRIVRFHTDAYRPFPAWRKRGQP